MKVLIYARCSTDESKQDVQNQVDKCKRYCEGEGWDYEIMQEYESAYNGNQRKAYNEALERIRLKEFNVLMVYMLDRFSRETPTKTVSDLHKIVEVYGCRFISLKETIDSKNEMWQIIMMIFAYMAHNYSKMLGVRVKEGINRKKKTGEYEGGRPKKVINMEKLTAILNQNNLSLRKVAQEYNKDLPKKEKISHVQVKRLLQKPSKDSKLGNVKI
jgi:DNA invertase Pin-like site-specific DNA recombinase